MRSIQPITTESLTLTNPIYYYYFTNILVYKQHQRGERESETFIY